MIDAFDLYDYLSDEICYDLKGEIVLDDDVIVWSYDIENHCDIIDEDGISEEDVEMFSIEEKLDNVYEHDLQQIKDSLLQYNNVESLIFTNPIKNKTSISFQIFDTA
jgi:hypothetical protein